MVISRGGGSTILCGASIPWPIKNHKRFPLEVAGWEPLNFATVHSIPRDLS